MPQLIPPAYSWQSQARQYAYRVKDAAGIHLERHHLGEWPNWTQIDCLLYRDEDGLLIGILNYYCDSNNPEEQQGNANIWVKPDRQRQGIGTALLREAMRRWDIDLNQQKYTTQGVLFVDGLLKKGLLRREAG